MRSSRNHSWRLPNNPLLQVVETCTLVMSLAKLAMADKERPREEREKLRAHCLTALRMKGGSHLAQNHVGLARKYARHVRLRQRTTEGDIKMHSKLRHVCCSDQTPSVTGNGIVLAQRTGLNTKGRLHPRALGNTLHIYRLFAASPVVEWLDGYLRNALYASLVVLDKHHDI